MKAESNFDKEIDIAKIITTLWKRRKYIMKWGVCGVVAGLIIGFSIPREYTTTVTLAPEIQSSLSGLGSLGGFAAMAGIDFDSQSSGGGDAISAELYPEVVSSLPFITDLFNVEVTTLNGEYTSTLYNYMLDEQRAPWWSYILGAPLKLISWVTSAEEDEDKNAAADSINIQALTLKQYSIFQAIESRIYLAIDENTSVISVFVEMQDPQVSCDIAEVVVQNIQRYIVDYRTKKAKETLRFTQQMYDEAKQKYHESLNNWAKVADHSRNYTSQLALTSLQRLEEEKDIDYSVYSTLAQNLEDAKLKMQNETPVYVVIEPATRPIGSSSPNKILIIILLVLLTGFIACAKVIAKEKLL